MCIPTARMECINTVHNPIIDNRKPQLGKTAAYNMHLNFALEASLIDKKQKLHHPIPHFLTLSLPSFITPLQRH